MPSLQGLRTFVRKDKIEFEEWFELLEARAGLLKSFLDSSTLPELGHLKCLHNADFFHEIDADNPKIVSDGNFSLKTQGIFQPQPSIAIEYFPGSGLREPSRGFCCLDGVVRSWGLTRSGQWVLISVNFSGQKVSGHRKYEKAEIVLIEETDLATIMSMTKCEPKGIWFELGKAVRDIVERRRQNLNAALAVEKVIDAEELAFSVTNRDR
ncbi:MAG: hypothetical protein NTZ44_00345 [Candidatus Nomurabacteria bacterium]|nr:hypothetical protein [Candidatus Nomurabacteria bacterium]MCX6788853.1 hypothetical protein [Candidatus Jorgensenbacteria bacterium]